MALKPHQLDLLRSICQDGSVPTSRVDGRALRPLVRLELVADSNGTLRATPAGCAIAQQEKPSAPQRPQRPRAPRSARPARRARQAPVSTSLSASQEEVLRYLLRQTGPVPADHIDGRVRRALLARGLVTEEQGWMSPASSAELSLRTHSRRDRARSLRRAANSARSARGEAILRATDMLEAALPRGAEVMIADLLAYGDDVVAGLRKLARELE